MIKGIQGPLAEVYLAALDALEEGHITAAWASYAAATRIDDERARAGIPRAFTSDPKVT